MAREYRRVSVAWADPEAVRQYNREAQRRWRAIHAPHKRDRDERRTGALVGAVLALVLL